MTDDPRTFDPWSREGRASAAENQEPASKQRDENDLLSDLPGDRNAPERPDRRTRRILRRVLIGAVALLAVGALVIFGGIWYLTNHFGDKIDRIPDVFAGIPEAQRPDKPAGDAGESVTFLLAGSDRRSDVPTTGGGADAPAWIPGLQRSDAIMLVHLTGDRGEAYVVSIPRDSWVEIPGRGMNKINAAYSLGGPALYIQTVEHLTGMRIDHLAVIDWEGFQGLTNAVGGVEINVDGRTESMDGDAALAYVRQRHGLPRGDLDRVRRQQNYLRALMNKTLTRGTLASPARLNDLLNAIGDSVSVDDTLSNTDLRDLALGLRSLRSNDVTFMTAPVAGLGREGAASVVYLDDELTPHLWEAIKSDDLGTYLTAYGRPEDQLGDDVD